MSKHEEEDVTRVMRAVGAAYHDLQALRASGHPNIPSSLFNLHTSLDKLGGRLNVLHDSPKALSIFRGYTMNMTGNSDEILLSGAIVNDMKATAKYLGDMTRVGLFNLPVDVHEQNCRKIQEMVHQYETIVSTVLSKHKECVHDEWTQCVYLNDRSSRSRLNSLTAQGRETHEMVEGISRRQAEQQEAELADLRASESFSTLVCGDSALTRVKRSTTD
jgi:hypothetical protein